MNLIQELPSKYKESTPQQIQMPCVKTINPVQPQYGAVQPPSTIAQADQSQDQRQEIPRASGMEDMLLEGYMSRGPQQLEHKLQQSAPNTINITKTASSKIMMNTNDLFDNVLHLEEEDEQQEPRLNKITNQSSMCAQGMYNGDEGRKAAGTNPVIKAILKTKKLSSVRFEKIAAQCLGQAEAKRGRGQKDEIIERLPLQSEDSDSSDFNPLMSQSI